MIWVAIAVLFALSFGAAFGWALRVCLVENNPARRGARIRPSETLAVLANWPPLEGRRRTPGEPTRITEEQLLLATTARCANPDSCPVCQAATKRGSE